jgi:hypothetical protein
LRRYPSVVTRAGIAGRTEHPPQLHYHILHHRAIGAEHKARQIEAYECWHRVWSETFRELDGTDNLFSDDFTRQDEIGALYQGNECIGVTGYRWINLEFPYFKDDSYFRAWPREILESIAATTPRVCVGSNLAVAPEWRGARHGFRVGDLLLALHVRRFHETNPELAQIMLGTMRNNRGMNALSYRLGATPIVEGAIHHGVEVDLVIFRRQATDWARLSGGIPIQIWRESAKEACR